MSVTLLLALWVPALCLIWVVIYAQMVWLHTGRLVRWSRNKGPRSRREAYLRVALGGMLTGMFITSPATSWGHWSRAHSLTNNFFVSIAPGVVVPLFLLFLSRTLDRTGTSAAGHGAP
jgi:hypothetical protein